MNLAALWKLPVLFICENNYYAMGTALERSESEPDVCRHAQSYRIRAEAVDGMDVVAVARAARAAADAVRRCEGPVFIEARTYRFRAHSMFDPELYRDKAEVAAWRARCPIARFRTWAVAAGLLHEADIAEIEAGIAAEIGEAVAFAEAAAWEPATDLLRDVTAPQAGAAP